MTALYADLENRRQEDEIASENWPDHAIPSSQAERVASKIGTLIHKVLNLYAEYKQTRLPRADRQNGHFLGTQPATLAALCG